MAKPGKLVKPDRKKSVGKGFKAQIQKSKSLRSTVKSWGTPSKQDLNFSKIQASTHNYVAVAKGLGIDLGSRAKPISYQVLNKKLRKEDVVKLENEKRWIDLLYLNGYETTGLRVTFVQRVQEAILNTLPF